MTRNSQIIAVMVIVAGVASFLVLTNHTVITNNSNHSTNVNSPPTNQGVRITLKRTACFGTCPDYSLSIDANGNVMYEGRMFVKTVGTRTATISKDDVQKLVDAFYAADYFSLKDEYTAPITDMPTATTSITVNGMTKQVIDYYGAPEKLHQLENMIDEVTNSEQWIQ